MRKQNVGLAAAVLIGVAVSSSSFAQTRVQPNTGPVIVNPNYLALIFRIDCVVRGTPTEFPNDIRLTNAGAATIPAGHKVRWVINAPHYEGIYTFGAALATGKNVFLNNVIPGGVAAGTPCTLFVVK